MSDDGDVAAVHVVTRPDLIFQFGVQTVFIKRAKGRQGHAFTDKGGQEQTKTHNEQGSKREPPSTRGVGERARALKPAAHHYAREAPVTSNHWTRGVEPQRPQEPFGTALSRGHVVLTECS